MHLILRIEWNVHQTWQTVKALRPELRVGRNIKSPDRWWDFYESDGKENHELKVRLHTMARVWNLGQLFMYVINSKVARVCQQQPRES